jgi:hypothetical protein
MRRKFATITGTSMKIAPLALLCSMLMAAPLLAAELSPQDHAEIQQLYAKYNHAIDSGNSEEWAATFTPDGVFNNRFTGRDALIGFVNNWKVNGTSRRHWNSNLIVTATAQGAKGSVYLMLLDVSIKPAGVLSTGVYSDELVKTAEGWRFKTRAVKIDAPAQPAPPAADKPK